MFINEFDQINACISLKTDVRFFYSMIQNQENMPITKC